MAKQLEHNGRALQSLWPDLVDALLKLLNAPAERDKLGTRHL